MARLTAEGEAVDYSRRLTVAQEQLAEYAAQKEEDAAGYLQQAQSLEKLLTSWLETNDNSPAGVQAAARDLCQKLAEEAGEAKSFAAQQKADVERAKRTSSQVSIVEPRTDTLMTCSSLRQAYIKQSLLLLSLCWCFLRQAA